MKTFTDKTGREWHVRINDAALRRVRKLIGTDLKAIANERGLKAFELFKDTPRLVDVIYVLCKPEADKIGITDEDFGRAIADERSCPEAVFAFATGLVELCADPRARSALRALVAEHKKGV